MTISIDGHVVGDRATISVKDHGLLYGDGVFEGIRVHGGGVFRLDDHLARLAYGASALGLTLPFTLTEIRDQVLGTCRAHGTRDGYVRLIATRGEGPLGVNPLSCEPSRIICIVENIALFDADKRTRGLSMITSSLRRPPADVLDPRVKSLNYLNNVMAKREAILRGADEALLLNAAGTIAEAAVANLFVVRRGALLTPPVTDGALEGITRRSVLELALELGIVAGERSLGRMDLISAEEAFLTGSGAGLVPIASLDGSAVGSGERPVFAKLERAFRDLLDRLKVPFLATSGARAPVGESRYAREA